MGLGLILVKTSVILAVKSSRIESVELPPVCTTLVGFTMATDQCLGLGLVVEQVLGFCYDTMSKIFLVYFIYFCIEKSMVI